MEWAEGIIAHDGQMVASILSDGESQRVHLSQLARKGLPITPSANIRLKRVALSEIEEIDASDYVAAFGLEPRLSASSRHAVYRLKWNEFSWIIPALAIQRGIFKPNRLLLEHMFRPQAIDHLCVPSESHDKNVELIAPWAHLSLSRLTDPRPLLRWLSNSNSGRRTAASVHSYAVQGRIGIDLPNVTADISLQGLVRGDTVYVTRCSINRIHDGACEALADSAATEGTLRLSCSRDERSVLGVAASLTVPRQQDGSVTLQDAEWAQIEPMVRPTGRASRTQADLRMILDGILLKLSGAEWKDLSRPGLNYQNFVHYYRKWVNSGLIHELISMLAASRKACV